MVRRSRFWLRYFPTGPPNSTATAAISASQKSDKTNWAGQVPIRNIPISSGTEPDYFRNTPTKARPLYLYLCQPRFLRTIGTGTQPHQCRKPATDLLLPLRPNQHTERDDRHPRQSVVVRRIHRLGSSERGN